MTYTRNFRHLCQSVTVFRPEAEPDEGWGYNDANHVHAATLTARVRELKADEALEAGGAVDGKTAQIIADIEQRDAIGPQYVVKDKYGQFWRVSGPAALMGEPMPRAIWTAALEPVTPRGCS